MYSRIHLVFGGEVGGVSPCVVHSRVSQVIRQVLNGSPVTIAWTKNPNIENIASLPFFSSFTFSSAKVSGSSAKFRGSNEPRG
ncbi:hypothetical protein Mapa_007990 [Marchantia paleacea]|nr:hypothetical protein Mapa_007990 [Marchantia paleacea]